MNLQSSCLVLFPEKCNNSVYNGKMRVANRKKKDIDTVLTAVVNVKIGKAITNLPSTARSITKLTGQ